LFCLLSHKVFSALISSTTTVDVFVVFAIAVCPMSQKAARTVALASRLAARMEATVFGSVVDRNRIAGGRILAVVRCLTAR
jgi:hypothetical protein